MCLFNLIRFSFSCYFYVIVINISNSNRFSAIRDTKDSTSSAGTGYGLEKPWFTLQHGFKKRLLLSLFSSILSSVRPSIFPQMPARFPLKGFTWNLILMTSVKICLDIPGLVEFGHLIWSPKYVSLLPATLNRHIVLSSSEILSCYCGTSRDETLH